MFKLGDKVKIISTGFICTIINTGIKFNHVRYDDKGLYPPTGFFRDNEIEKVSSIYKSWNDKSYCSGTNKDNVVNTDMHCGKCHTKWSITRSPVHNTLWYDCLKCGKTREELEGSKQ